MQSNFIKTLVSLSLLLFLCVGCATTQQLIPRPLSLDPKQNVAIVSLQRSDNFRGAGRTFKVFDNDRYIGQIASGGSLLWERPPGKMHLRVDRPSGYKETTFGFKTTNVIVTAQSAYDFYINADGVLTNRSSNNGLTGSPVGLRTGKAQNIPPQIVITKPDIPSEIVATKINTKEKRLALIIGNSNYTHVGSLKNPLNDARSMKINLENLGFTVIKYEDSIQKTMKIAIDEFGRKLKNYDVGLFFFAGHGVQVKGNNYLIPVDAKLENENDAEYGCVRADRVLAKMEAASSRTNIVILDACRDNPFERSWRRGTKGNGLAFMNAPSGSIIAYATSPGNTAFDGNGTNGLYTSAILKHIQTPNVTIEKMFKLVRSTIMDWSGGKQVPWESTSLRGDFYFKSK